VQSIVIIVCVRLFVCLFVCLLAYLKTTCPNVTCYLWSWLLAGSFYDGNTKRYVRKFRFCGWRQNQRRVHVCFVEFARWRHQSDVRQRFLVENCILLIHYK